MNILLTPKREEKVWGTVTHIFANPHAAISLPSVIKGYRCSIHYHRKRGNQFAVRSGALVVESLPLRWSGILSSVEQFNEYKEMRLLGPEDVLSVPAQIWHRFRVLASGDIVEVYWDDKGAVQLQDIVRLDEGGIDDLEELKRELTERGIDYSSYEG